MSYNPLSSLFSITRPATPPTPRTEELKCTELLDPVQESKELSPVQLLLRLEETIQDVLISAWAHEAPLSKELKDSLAMLENLAVDFFGPEEEEEFINEAPVVTTQEDIPVAPLDGIPVVVPTLIRRNAIIQSEPVISVMSKVQARHSGTKSNNL